MANTFLTMLNTVTPNEPISFAGDWHGDSYIAQQCLKTAKEKKNKILFQVGDFGIWPGNKGTQFLQNVSDAATQNNVNLIVVLGNHEDYNQIEKMTFQNGAANPLPNIWLLNRITQFKIGDVKFGTVGGGISIDRNVRTLNETYWPQEQLTVAETKHALTLPPVDVLLTHDSPAGVNTPMAEQIPAFVTPEILKDANENRHHLREILDHWTPKINIHGHYHEFYTDTLDGIDTNYIPYNCDIIGLPDQSDTRNLITATLNQTTGLTNIETTLTTRPIKLTFNKTINNARQR